MSEEPINVVITHSLDEEYQRQIRDVSPRIRIRSVLDLVKAEDSGDPASRKQLDAVLSDAEVIFGRQINNVISRTPKLKWIQSPVTGVNNWLTPEVVDSPVVLTNSRGIHGTQASELVFTHMLMLAKKAPMIMQLKEEKRYYHFAPGLLQSKTIGILGMGPIGKEVARLAKAFGMRVIVVRAHAKIRSRYADVTLPPQQLPEMLSQSDYVVLALPATPETIRLIGEKELRTMKPTAYLINIARGSIIDEEMLIRALEEGWIAGAGLDAFTKEPLPADSKLWDLPNVIITSHIAGEREDYNLLATRLFCENLKRYLSGKKLINVINKKRGY